MLFTKLHIDRHVDFQEQKTSAFENLWILKELLNPFNFSFKWLQRFSSIDRI